MEEMVASRKLICLPPSGSKRVVQMKTLVVVRENRVHPDIQDDTFARLLQCEIFVPYTYRCTRCVEDKP